MTRNDCERYFVDRIPVLLVIVALLVYAGFFTWLSVLRHNRFWTGGYDLGNFDQAVWNTLHGRILRLTNVPHATSRLGLHFEPILIPLSLVYLFWSDARALLVVQTIAVVVSAIPVYWFGRERLGSWSALGLTVAYLLFPALEGANIFEFHTNTLSLPFLTFAYYYLEKRQRRHFLMFAGLAMMCREDIILMVGMMGVYLLVVYRDKTGFFVALAAALLLCLVVFVFIPYFSKTGAFPPLVGRYDVLGGSWQQTIWIALTRPHIFLRHILSDPDRVRYLTHLMAPVAFLSLLDPLTLLPAAPIVALNLLSNWNSTYALDYFHYSATIVPFIIFAAINGVERLTRWVKHWRGIAPQFTLVVLTSAILLVSLGYHRRFGHTPLALGFELPRFDPRYASVDEMFQLIPPRASLSAQSNLNPHLSQRPVIYLFPKLDDAITGPAEYVALDQRGNIYPVNPEKYNSMLEKMRKSGKYRVIFDQDGFLLLRVK